MTRLVGDCRDVLAEVTCPAGSATTTIVSDVFPFAGPGELALDYLGNSIQVNQMDVILE